MPQIIRLRGRELGWWRHSRYRTSSKPILHGTDMHTIIVNMTHAPDFPFIDLDHPPEGWLVPDTAAVEEDMDLWVGMACNVAIEGHTGLPADPDGLREAARAGRTKDQKALACCVRAWKSLEPDTPITGDILRRLNRLVRGDTNSDAGAWRTSPVFVMRVSRRWAPTIDPRRFENEDVERHFEYETVQEVLYEAPPAPLVPEMMEKYLEGIEQWGDHPLAPWWAHLMLVLIHPWGDGNGRTSRLVEAHLFRRQGVPAPWASTRNNWPHRPLYYQALNETRDQIDPGVFYHHQIQMRESPAPMIFTKEPRFITGEVHTRSGPPPATEPPPSIPKVDMERDRKALKWLASAHALPPDHRELAMGRYWSALYEDED